MYSCDQQRVFQRMLWVCAHTKSVYRPRDKKILSAHNSEGSYNTQQAAGTTVSCENPQHKHKRLNLHKHAGVQHSKQLCNHIIAQQEALRVCQPHPAGQPLRQPVLQD